MPFADFDGKGHNGIMMWSSRGKQPKLYIDEMVIIHHFDKDFLHPLAPSSSSSSGSTASSSPSSSSSSSSTSAVPGDNLEGSASFVFSNLVLAVLALICTF